jgi:hypothetical protein
MVGQGGNQSDAFTKLQKTKYMTLIGATIVVLSSSFLYINSILWFVYRGPFETLPWLNPFTMGANADSILNDVGMVLLCGILKRLRPWSPKMPSRGVSARSSKNHTIVAIMPSFNSEEASGDRYGTVRL